MSNDKIIKLTKFGFYLIALIWLILGVDSFIHIQKDGESSYLIFRIIALLMFGNAAVLLICGIWITSGKLWFYLFSIAVLSVNILLTVTDQFGLMDLLTLLLDLSLLAVLLVKRSAFLSR